MRHELAHSKKFRLIHSIPSKPWVTPRQGTNTKAPINVLVYTVILGLLLTMFFDLTRIAAMGIIFYLIMDIAVHWGILRHLRRDIGARLSILIAAIILDLIVLVGFIWIKMGSDRLVVVVAGVVMLAILIMEVLFLRYNPIAEKSENQ